MQSDIEKSDTKSGLLVETHSGIIIERKEVDDKHSGAKDPDRELDSLGDTDMSIEDMKQGKMIESMKPDTRPDLLVETPSVVIGNKREVEVKHSGTKEPDREFNNLEASDMDIVDMNQGETIEHMQPDVERSDTEPDPLVGTQSGVINEMEESEGKHSGTDEPNWKSNLLEDTSMNIDDMNQGEMVKACNLM